MFGDFTFWYWYALVVITIITAFVALGFWFWRIRRHRGVPRERGQLLDGRYRIGYELGRGLNAVALIVQDIQKPEAGLVAKLLMTPEDEPRISPASFIRHLRRFRQEMENLRKLQDSMYVVPVYSFHVNAVPSFFVMKRCDGSLMEELTRTPLPMQEVLDVLVDVCRGLAESHRRQIIHRDLKPANILRHEGHWVLADFGMSLLGEKGSPVTVPESLPGTIPYTAPEVMYYESESIKFSADVFSLGVTLKEMLTGANVWEGSTSSLLRGRIKQTTREEIELFDELVAEMMILRPEDRPQTVGLVVQKLHQIFKNINNMRNKRDLKRRSPLLKDIDRLKQKEDFAT